MAGISTPVRALSFNAQWPMYGSTQAKVRAGKVRSWTARKAILALKVKAARSDVVMIQELGQAQAAELFALLPDYSYQRFGPLNVVGWRRARFDQSGETQEITLPAHGQYPGRGAVVVTLVDKDGNRLRICSTHFSVKLGGSAFSRADSAAQQEQLQKIVSAVNDEDDDAPLVIGVDTNNKQLALTGGMWKVARKYGYTWDRSGVDAVLWNFGVVINRIDRLDLGAGSDHDGRIFTLTTTKK